MDFEKNFFFNNNKFIMKTNSKIAVVAGLGAIAGGVAGYYLNSDKGRQQREKANEAIKAQAAKASSLAGDIANKTKNMASDFTAKAQEALSSTSQKVEQAKEAVSDGMDHMKNKSDRMGSYGNTGVSR